MQLLFITILICGSLVDYLDARPYTYSQFGDVIVTNDGENFRCDKIICPAGTFLCKVTKIKEYQNSNFIERRNICYGYYNEILLAKTSRDAVPASHTANLDISVTANGSVSQSSASSNSGSFNQQNIDGFDAQAFNKNLQNQIQESVRQALESAKQGLNNGYGGWAGPWG